MQNTQEPQNVVIVGAGFAGVNVFNGLSGKLNASNYNLILITARPFLTHFPAAIRMVVTSEGHLEDRIFWPLGERFTTGNNKLIVGQVVSVVDDDTKGRYVVLDNGDNVPFSVLVLAPGSNWEGAIALPNTKSEIVASVQNWRGQIGNAKDIVLVGGGSIGAELAGEIKDLDAGKNVTIVHSKSQLLNETYPDRWRKSITDSVRVRGVDLVLGDYIDDFDIKDGKITTRSGNLIKADLVIPTRGPRPNTKFIGESLGDNVLTPSGFVKVSPTLQLSTHPRIFAGGDIIDWNEQKQAGKTPGHAAVISNNVLVLLGQKKSLTKYKGSTEIILVTNGKNGGSGYFGILWGITIGDWLTALLKSKGLLVDMLKGSLKL